MKSRNCARLGLLLSWLIAAASAAQAAEIRVFAAASLVSALREIAPEFERKAGHRLVFNFGASSALARQIQEGAPADVFFSADEAQMEGLEKKGLLAPGTHRSLLSNVLVIVTPADSAAGITAASDLATDKVKRLALADPKGVPAGVYAREYLAGAGLWARVEPKVIPTENVRAALAAVESGNVEAGVVYRTDASISSKVKIAVEINPGPSISYPVAVAKDAEQPAAARQWLEHLRSPAASAIFTKHGFIIQREPRP